MRKSAFLVSLTLLLAVQQAWAVQGNKNSSPALMSSFEDDFIAQAIGDALRQQEQLEAAEQAEHEAYVKVEDAIDQQLKNMRRRHQVTIPQWFFEDNYDLPVSYNQHVVAIIDFFTGKGRGFFTKWLARSSELKPIVLPILREYGVPEDLFFLSMIESGFSMKAYSGVGAAGPWQFMPFTGRDYNLRVDGVVDQRMDLIKSTRAAARYLRNLYKQFGDWNLAMASYNWGQGSVQKAVKRCGSNNYWELVNSSCMPEETKQYVPKVYAAAIIYKNAERYGFEKPRELEVEPVKTVKVPNGLTFSQISDLTGVPFKEIARYNYALLGHKTPATGAFTFYVGESYVGKIQGKYERLQKVARNNAGGSKKSSGYSGTGRAQIHKVKKGESITAIARKYNVKAAAIRKLNGLKNDNIRIGMSLKIPAVEVLEPQIKPATKIAAKSTVKQNGKPVASTVAKSKTAPSGKPKGQTAVAQTGKAKASTAKKTTVKTVKVQAGDNLWKIAKKHGLTVEQLLRLNKNIDAKKPLKAGTLVRVAAR